MKVYQVDNREGYSTVLGLFSTREKAEQFIQNLKAAGKPMADSEGWMIYYIEEIEVDKLCEVNE